MFNFFKKRKNILQIAFVIALCFVFLIPTISHGQYQGLAPAYVGVGKAVITSQASAAASSVMEDVSSWFASLLLTFGGWILWAGGSLLDVTVTSTIVGMNEWIGPGPNNLGQVINQTWTAFRDLANMGFIFILLYVAIGTIIGLGDVNMKKMLSRVIIVALLINFSLFFTKLIVDTSNIGSVVFYNAILADPVNNNSEGISSPFMAKMGITGLWSAGTAAEIIQGGQNGAPKNTATKMLVLGVFGFIFMLVAAFVFFAFAILLIIRFVIIILLFILSPLAFAAMALPKDKYSGQWWEALWDQVIFAPVCFALLWVVLKMLEVISPTGVTTLGTAFVGENGQAPVGGGGMIMNFAIIIVFTVAALIIAKKLGASGAKSVLSLGNKLRAGAQGYIGGATFGGLGYLGRRTVGWTGRNIAESEGLKKGQAAGGFRGALYGATRAIAQKTAGASFDVRASKIGGELAGNIPGGLGKAGGKGGYDKYVEANQKRALAEAKSLAPSRVLVDQAKQTVGKLETQVSEQRRDIEAKYSSKMITTEREKQLEAELKKEQENIDNLKKEQFADQGKLLDKKLPVPEREKITRDIKDREVRIMSMTNSLSTDMRHKELEHAKTTRAEIQKEMNEEISKVEDKLKNAKQRAEELGGAGKKRALEYASEAVEKPWRKAFRLYKNKKDYKENNPIFSGTRQDEAMKIRGEFNKGKADKIIEDLAKAMKEEEPKEEKKEGGDKEDKK